MNTPLNDLATFFAYSLLMEQESAERLRELADVMAHHHRSELQEILLELAAYSDKHAGEVAEVSGNLPLPELKPWDFDWPGVEPPETFDYAALRYEMSPRQLLEVALELEDNSAAFYADIARHSKDEEIRQFADAFASEEQSHADALNARLERLPPDLIQTTDIDPPHQPE